MVKPFGLWPFPHTQEPSAADDIAAFAAANSGIMVATFDDGIPWTEALNNDPLPAANTSRATRTNAYKGSLPVFVSVRPTLDSGAGMKPPPPGSVTPDSFWKAELGATWSDPDAIAAYTNFIRWICTEISPTWVNLGQEGAEVAEKFPTTLWPEYLAMHQAVYSQMKLEFPAIKFGTSIGLPFLRKPAVASLLTSFWTDYNDWIGLSWYPFVPGFYELLGASPISRAIPDQWEEQFTWLDTYLPGIPKALAETSYSSRAGQYGFTDAGSGSQGSFGIQGSLVFQDAYIRSLPSRNWEFVNWLGAKDYWRLWIGTAFERDGINELWRYTSLVDETDGVKPTLETWRAVVNETALPAPPSSPPSVPSGGVGDSEGLLTVGWSLDTSAGLLTLGRSVTIAVGVSELPVWAQAAGEVVRGVSLSVQTATGVKPVTSIWRQGASSVERIWGP